MLVFGEILAFETPSHDSKVDESSALVVIFSSSEGTPEATVMTRGITLPDPNGNKYKVFGFNRPFTRECGERLIFQVIQFYRSGAQSLIGYGYCDLDVELGVQVSREIKVSLWRPRSDQETINKYRGTFTPFVEPEYVTLPPEIEREKLHTVSTLGKVRIRIQRSSYH